MNLGLSEAIFFTDNTRQAPYNAFMKLRIAIWLGIIVILGLSAQSVAACVCPQEYDLDGNQIPRNYFAEASHVFSGKLLSAEKAEGSGPYYAILVFQVREIWKGSAGAGNRIRLYLSGWDCDPGLELNKNYLIYAGRLFGRNPFLSTNICFNNLPLKHAKRAIKSFGRPRKS